MKKSEKSVKNMKFSPLNDINNNEASIKKKRKKERKHHTAFFNYFGTFFKEGIQSGTETYLDP